jgi:hypothetical protein
VAEWFRTDEKMPPEGLVVIVLNGPHEQMLVFERGLWWLADRSMYVYFTPKLWRLP